MKHRAAHTLAVLAALALATTAQVQARGRRVIGAAVDFGNGKAYFFRGAEYIRYDIAADRADPGYPKAIAAGFPGLFDRDIDAAFNAGNGKAYFFRGAEYIRYDIAADRADPGFPRPIVGKWPGVWDRDIDAAFGAGNGKAFLFKGGDYVRYDIAADRADPGYPRPVVGKWPGVWDRDIDAAFGAGNGKAFLFKGGDYVRYDIAADRGDAGYPRPIAGKWPGVWTSPLEGGPVTQAPPPVPLPAPTQTGQPPVPQTDPRYVDLPDPPDWIKGATCQQESIVMRDGSCKPKPSQQACYERVTADVDARGLLKKRVRDLTMEEARDVVVALHHRRLITLGTNGHAPVFNSTTCAIVYPPMMSYPAMTQKTPIPGAPSMRTAIMNNVNGVVFKKLMLAQAPIYRRNIARASTPRSYSNLDMRMVVGLYKLTEVLRRYGATTVFIQGMTDAAGKHFETGRTIDFAGACGGRLGSCGDQPGAPAQGLFVADDWGFKPVPASKAAPGDPNHWAPAVTDTSYRLDLPGADALAREFFLAVYTVFRAEWEDGADRPSLRDTGLNITPDYPLAGSGSSGRNAHRDHIHAQIRDKLVN